jgi:hypothetical protein
MFKEYDMGTDLYTRFWTAEHRSRLVLFLTHYFQKFRQPSASLTTQPTGVAAGAA